MPTFRQPSQDTSSASPKNSFELGARTNGPSTDTSDDAEDEEFVEGGFWGWATVVGAVLVQFCGFGYCTAFGVFQDYYIRIYMADASPALISWIGSVNSFLSIACSLFTGVLYDKGYFYHMLYGGNFLLAFSLFMLSLAKPNQLYQVFLAQGIGFGLGAGLTFLPSVAIVSEYFQKKRTIAMMLVVSGGSLGGAIHPILLNALLNKIGFSRATQVSAGMIAGLLAIASFLLRVPSRRKRVTAAGPIKESSGLGDVLARSVKDAPFVCLSISLALFAIGFYYPVFYLQLDAIKHGVNETFSFYIFTIMNFACLIGGLLPVLIVKSVGVTNLLIGSAVSTAATVFALVGLKDLASSVVITVVFGFFIGMFFGLQAPVIVLLTPNHSELGARLGIGFTFVAVGALVGPPIHGQLLSSHNYMWWKPAIFSGIFASLGAMGFALIPILVRNQRRKNSTPA